MSYRTGYMWLIPTEFPCWALVADLVCTCHNRTRFGYSCFTQTRQRQADRVESMAAATVAYSCVLLPHAAAAYCRCYERKFMAGLPLLVERTRAAFRGVFKACFACMTPRTPNLGLLIGCRSRGSLETCCCSPCDDQGLGRVGPRESEFWGSGVGGVEPGPGSEALSFGLAMGFCGGGLSSSDRTCSRSRSRRSGLSPVDSRLPGFGPEAAAGVGFDDRSSPYTCTYAYTCTCRYTYTYVHTHTHTINATNRQQSWPECANSRQAPTLPLHKKSRGFPLMKHSYSC